MTVISAVGFWVLLVGQGGWLFIDSPDEVRRVEIRARLDAAYDGREAKYRRALDAVQRGADAEASTLETELERDDAVIERLQEELMHTFDDRTWWWATMLRAGAPGSCSLDSYTASPPVADKLDDRCGGRFDR